MGAVDQLGEVGDKKPPWTHLNGLEHMEQEPMAYHKIDCLINEETTIGCRREGQEVYVPFTFVAKYFEVGLRLHMACGYATDTGMAETRMLNT